jgi:hypothetical protein
MTDDRLPVPLPSPSSLLTAAQYQRLADVPPEIEWFAHLNNKSTGLAFENALQDCVRFTRIVPSAGISHRDPWPRHCLGRRPRQARSGFERPDVGTDAELTQDAGNH